MSKEKNKKNYVASFKWHIILLLIFSAFIAWILYKPLVSFITKDHYPSIVPINSEKNQTLIQNSAIVQAGMYVQDFSEFDFVHDQFTADVIVWFKFDPKKISLDKIEKFSFDRGKFEQKSPPKIQEEDDKIFARYYLKVTFKNRLNYIHFPLDDHKINLIVTNYSISPSEAIFKSFNDNIIIDKKLKLIGWDLIGKEVKTGYIKNNLYPYGTKDIYHPRIIFSINFSKSGIRHLIYMLIPFLLVFLFLPLTLIFDPFKQSDNIITISLAVMSGLLAHRFIVGGMSPTSPGYLMLADKIFILLIIGSCIIFIFNVFGDKISGFYKNIIIFLLYVYVALGLLYFLYPIIK